MFNMSCSESLSGEKGSFYGKHHTKETKAKVSAKLIGHFVSKEAREKMSIALVKRLKQNPIFINKNKMETKLEILLNELFHNEYKFVGDYKFWIENFNPDFINCNGQKKIIELYGDYWHRNTQDRDTKRLVMYKKYGYKTLVIWEKELKDSSSLITRLKEFHNVGN